MVTLANVIKEALLKQARIESGAYLAYKQGSLWFTERHLTGIGKFLETEADSERVHSDQIYNYIVLRGGSVNILSPVMIETAWTTEASVFQFFLDLEKKNTNEVYNLFKLARQIEDFDAERFLAPFLQKQHESVSEWEGHVEKIISFTKFPGLIWHLDSII